MLPNLYGTGKAQHVFLDTPLYKEFIRHCEVFEITADGTYSFRADICTPDRIQLFDGDLLELLTANFRALMDLKYFHEGRFWLHVPLSPSTLLSADFCAEVISMCSALGIGIEVHSNGKQEPS